MGCAVTGVRILHGKILIGINKFIPEKAMAPQLLNLHSRAHVPQQEKARLPQSLSPARKTQ